MRGVMREIEAQPAGLDHAAGLLHVRAQHLAQRGVQQVRRRVIAHRGVAQRRVHSARSIIADCDRRVAVRCDARSGPGTGGYAVSTSATFSPVRVE